MAKYYETLFSAIKAMHREHSVGDVEEIGVFADGRIEVTAKRGSYRPDTHTGRFVTKSAHAPFGKFTIYMYGRQRTVTIIGKEE